MFVNMPYPVGTLGPEMVLRN